ncbi:MAG: alpha/beta fold hydrolase [Candidatus Micrarchaeota archaeon]|nr:alpha/beta fold hydrolase [Candidatus Micrarchaeota archaeon]
MKGEIVSFVTKDGLKLHGFLARPGRKRGKTLIYLHGLEGTFYSSGLIKALADSLPKIGYDFLAIEQRGSYTVETRTRKKGRKYKGTITGGGFERFEECIYDIGGAIRLAGVLGSRRIILAGHSTGCQKAVYYQYKEKDRKVKGIVLLAPADDYNMQKRDLGGRFGGAVSAAKRLYRNDKYSIMPRNYIRRPFGTHRFLSFSDLKFVESRIFNYDLPRLREFGSIRQPVLAIFGSKEQFAAKPVKEYMEILERNSGAQGFSHSVIKGANHGFWKKEKETARVVADWLAKLDL